VLSGIGNESILDTTLLAIIATPIAGGARHGDGLADRPQGQAGVRACWTSSACSGWPCPAPWSVSATRSPSTRRFSSPIGGTTIQVLPALGGGAAIFGGAMAIVMVYIIRSLPSGQRSGIAALAADRSVHR
jgi:iron(III) transport system permease protein